MGAAATEESVVDVLGDWARRRPAAEALCAPGRRSLTYGELIGLVAETSAALRRLGIEPGDRVVTVLPDNAEAAVLLLGLVDSAVCCPLNPMLTEAEVEEHLALVGATAMVVQQGLSAGARAVAVRMGLSIIELAPRASEAAGTFVLSRSNPPTQDRRTAGDDAPALILPTSGTTAGAKLVPLEMSTILAGARASVRAYQLGPEDRRLNVMPLFHVQGLVGSVVTSLVAGGGVVCCPSFDPGLLLRWVEEHEVTWFSGSATMHRAAIDAARPSGRRPRHALRFLRAGSGPLSPGLMHELEDFWGVPAIESYGMTEAHQIASSPLPPGVRKPGTAGVPTGSEIAVVDEGGAPVPSGQVGEILVRGANVIRRYLAPDEVNAASFVDGWLRTGDVGFLDADGYLTLTDRVKEIIIRGGEKVSPREVDMVLESHPAVDRAATFGYPHPVLTQEVAAAVILDRAQSVTEEELQRFAADRLARFKVPKRIVVVDELPASSTGKVFRNKLAQELGMSGSVEAPAPVSEARAQRGPNGPIEAALAGIWAQALGREHVAVDDDFFELGGDSLSGILLLSMVQEVLGHEIPAMMLYEEANTVARMASVVEAARAAHAVDRVV